MVIIIVNESRLIYIHSDSDCFINFIRYIGCATTLIITLKQYSIHEYQEAMVKVLLWKV